MIRNIIELYALGGVPITHLFGELIEFPREIIDVEYEDVSDQTDAELSIPSTGELKLLEYHKQTNNNVNPDN